MFIYSSLQISCCNFLQSNLHICFGCCLILSQSGNANKQSDGSANVEHLFDKFVFLPPNVGNIDFKRSSICSC